MEQGKEPGAAMFGTAEVESQRTAPGKRSRRKKVFFVVALVCLLIIILAVALSVKNHRPDYNGEFWLLVASEETPKLHCPSGFSKPPLILVSLDGFRAEYFKNHSSHLPVINKLRSVGVTTTHMRPVYPTKTFPNHYSIVTGLYPESHGIVDNKMYDVDHNAFFSLKTDEKFSAKWYQGEPVWLTAMRHKLKAATFFWPGSDVAINGTFPDFYKVYDRSISFEERLSTIFQWLSLPQRERPDFFTLYLEEPDQSGHMYGPESQQVIDALKRVDKTLGVLMDGLTERGLHHCVNLIISSDHGMEEATCKKAAFVSTLQDNTEDFNIIQGPAARIRPTRLPDDYFSFDYEGLVKNLSCRAPSQPMRPFLKEHLPKRFHFANNKRIERGHLYMKQGWQAAKNEKEIKYCTGGFHGSDNVFTNMQAIFVGYGPGFKNQTVVPPFENIELYNLMCDLLGIRPSPNNGTHGSLNHLLRDPVHLPVNPAALSYSTPCKASSAVPTDDLQCSCSLTRDMEEHVNKPLIDVNSSDEVTWRRLHHPFGVPQVVQPGVSFCLLHHSAYLNGYSNDRLQPLWVSYTMRPVHSVQPLSPDMEACVRADIRVPSTNSQLCGRYRNNYNLTYSLLHPPSLSIDGSSFDSMITSNMVPMFPAFKAVWTHLHEELLPKFSKELNGVNVMSGPVFDEDFDGHVDASKTTSGNQAPIPTHFFMVLTSCGDQTFGPHNCQGPLRAQSFVLPHRADYIETCQTGSDLSWVEDWMHFHSARVKDVELLTGLSFYHDRISVEETLQLKTSLHIVQ